MARFKVNESVYIKHQGVIPWRIVQIDNPERGDDALYHLRDSRNTYEREFGRNLIGTDEPNASARASNSTLNEKVRIGDTELRGATTATLDFAKDRRGDYILAGDEVIADAGDGIDTYEVLKVLPGNKVKIGGLGVEVATVDAKTVSVTRKHGILKRDGDTVVLKNAKFKVGDYVAEKGNGRYSYRIVEAYGDGGYETRDDENGLRYFEEWEIEIAAPRPKYKAGAKVKIRKSGEVGIVDYVKFPQYKENVYQVGVRKGNRVDYNGYKESEITPTNSTIIRTSNPVVANAIAANFSARAKQSGSNAVRNLEEAHKYLDDVVNELMKSDDPNDAKLVEPVKKLRKDVNAILWKAMSIR